MKPKSKSITVEELLLQLEADPKYMAMREEQERKTAEWVARYKAEEQPLAEDFHRMGWDVDSAWTLVNTRQKYTELIPTLLDHLLRPYSDVVKDGIARALGVPEARFAWRIFVDEFKKALMGIGPDGIPYGYKDGLACTLCATVTPETLDEYIDLVRDTSQGDSRILLLSALRRSRNPKAKQALEDLADDPDLRIQIGDYRKADLRREKRKKREERSS